MHADHDYDYDRFDSGTHQTSGSARESDAPGMGREASRYVGRRCQMHADYDDDYDRFDNQAGMCGSCCTDERDPSTGLCRLCWQASREEKARTTRNLMTELQGEAKAFLRAKAKARRVAKLQAEFKARCEAAADAREARREAASARAVREAKQWIAARDAEVLKGVDLAAMVEEALSRTSCDECPLCGMGDQELVQGFCRLCRWEEKFGGPSCEARFEANFRKEFIRSERVKWARARRSEAELREAERNAEREKRSRRGYPDSDLHVRFDGSGTYHDRSWEVA